MLNQEMPGLVLAVEPFELVSFVLLINELSELDLLFLRPKVFDPDQQAQMSLFHAGFGIHHSGGLGQGSGLVDRREAHDLGQSLCFVLYLPLELQLATLELSDRVGDSGALLFIEADASARLHDRLGRKDVVLHVIRLTRGARCCDHRKRKDASNDSFHSCIFPSVEVSLVVGIASSSAP